MGLLGRKRSSGESEAPAMAPQPTGIPDYGFNQPKSVAPKTVSDILRHTSYPTGAEGFARFKPGTPDNYKPPVLVISYSDGNCAIIGGYVVRDAKVPDLAGRYVFGDNCNPAIYWTKLTGKNRGTRQDTGLRVSGLSSFGEDGSGRVYLTSLDGSVYRLKSK